MIDYLTTNYYRIIIELLRHLYIVLISLPVSIGIGITTGILISRSRRAERIVIGIASILMTIPSLALFGFAIIMLAPLDAGIGIPPAVFALVVYSFLPITRNTVIALHSVSPGIIASARGMGMTRRQILFRVRFPLSIPLIMAGVRNACIMGVSVTTIAYLVGAGGLGYFIFASMSRTNMNMILVGAIIVAAVGIGVDHLLLKIQERVTPRGLKQLEKEQ